MFILKEVMSELNVTSQLLSERTGIPKRTIDEYRSKRRRKRKNMYSVIEVAKYVISYCMEKGNPISNLQLQKMLYYLQVYLKNMRKMKTNIL